MPEESDHFVCPCCGMHAPIERLTDDGPFKLEAWHKVVGGKVKLTREQRLARRGKRRGKGSAPGSLNYYQIDVTPELGELIKKRIGELIRE